ncbi:hypothetical protein ACWC0C_29540 [Streptomyces sp. NPDC001709]
MAQETKGGPLPRVKCPATLYGSCGGRTIAAYPIAGAVGKGKVADHKTHPHDKQLCPGAGETVTLPCVSMLQLTTDDAPRQSAKVSAPPLPLFEVPD